MKRKLTYTTDAELEGIRYCAKVIDFGVSLSVTIAINELYTAHMMLRERRDLYRRELKSRANDAIRRAGHCRERMISAMSSRAFFDTFSDKVIDLSENDITVFRLSIKQTLDDHSYPDSELIAYAETARVMLDMARAHFNGVVSKAKEHAEYNYAAAFSEFNCADVLQAWVRVCEELYIANGTIDLNTERNLAAYAIIERKLVDGVYVGGCMKEAVTVFPEFANDVIVKQ